MAKGADSEGKISLAAKGLEKRNAAEKLQQEKKSRKKSRDRKGEADSSSATPSGKGTMSFWNRDPNTPQESDFSRPTYLPLSLPVHENLLTTNVESDREGGSMVSKTLNELFKRGNFAEKYIQGSRDKKIENVILIDNYVPKHVTSANHHTRALKRLSKRSKRHMSRKQHKKCGSFDLPQDLQNSHYRFNIFKPMHEIWKGYMMELLKRSGGNETAVAKHLLNADLHGAIILVADCKTTSFTGVSGIMIRETAETFCIITQDDKLRVVPKKFSVFIFQVGNWKITLHGDKLTSRNLGL